MAVSADDGDHGSRLQSDALASGVWGLRAAVVRGPLRYYEAIRPCPPHRYSAPYGFSRSGISPSPRHEITVAVSAGRFPRSVPEPGPGSRHLYAGRHLGSKQVSPRLIPRAMTHPGSAVTSVLTTPTVVRFRSPSWPPPDGLTARLFATLTTPGIDPAQLAVGLRASPCRAAAEGRILHLQHSKNEDHDLLHHDLHSIAAHVMTEPW